MIKSDGDVRVNKERKNDAVILMTQPFPVPCSVPEELDRITVEDKVSVKTEADSVDIWFPSSHTEEHINIKREMIEATSFIGVKTETGNEELTTVKREVKEEVMVEEPEVNALGCNAIILDELCHHKAECTGTDRSQAATSNVLCCKQNGCVSSVTAACGIKFTSDPTRSCQTCDMCSEAMSLVKVQPQPVSNEVSNGEDTICVQQLPLQDNHAKQESKKLQLPVTVQNRRKEIPDISLYSNRLKLKKSALIRKKTDEYGAFGKFIAQELRSLHSEVNRRLLKRMIQKAVLKVSELDDNKQTAAKGRQNPCIRLAEKC